MKIHEWISSATKQLTVADINTARLDAELILSHTLKKPRTWLHMYRDEELSDRYIEIAEARLLLRLDRVPLAYIIGHKEFYGRRFYVTPSVLIPRPESEAIIEALKEYVTPDDKKQLIDVGTGSGCLGITAKLELPNLDVSLVDISRHALTVAAKNAAALDCDVTISRSDLLESYPLQPDIILANLPYVDMTWERSPETNHEPREALFADDKGLYLIKKLIEQSGTRMPNGGLLFLEADPEQHSNIIAYGNLHGFKKHFLSDYCLVLIKV